MKVRPLKYREIVKRLKRYGFEWKRDAGGSHEIWWNPVTRKRLPVPKYKEFGPELIKKICIEINVDAHEFCGKRE